MKICILGGTGLVGQALKSKLNVQHQVTVAGRSAFASEQTLVETIKAANIIIQLSGANIGQRWSKGYKQQIWDSRIDTTHMLASAIAKLETPPERVFCASAIGFYPETTCDAPLDETCTTAGDNFLGKLSVAWEQAASKLASSENLVITRFGVVLDKHQGALAKMLPAFKLGLGGPVAGGKQCFSWVHIDDLVKAYVFLINNPQLNGVFNLSAPQPLPQKTFAKILAKTLKRPAFVPLPLWQLKLIFGEGAQVLTHSSAVLPTKLQQAGFEFQHPDASNALKNLLK